MNGFELTGPMVWKMMNSYVEAINQDKIPHIESTWDYLLKSELEKKR